MVPLVKGESLGPLFLNRVASIIVGGTRKKGVRNTLIIHLHALPRTAWEKGGSKSWIWTHTGQTDTSELAP